MVMRKRLDCERMGGEGITAGRGEMGMGGFGMGIVVEWSTEMHSFRADIHESGCRRMILL